MKEDSKTAKDSQGREYKEIDGLSFHPETDDTLCRKLAELAHDQRETRIRIFYGDHETGRAWLEENDVTGYIGHSTGSIKIPLLIHSRRSYGGGAILDHCILKLQTTSGRVLWQAENYRPKVIFSGVLIPPETIDGRTYVAAVWTRELEDPEEEKERYSRHTSVEKAYRLASFLRGERGSK